MLQIHFSELHTSKSI